ncbi:MAG: ectoine hydroxylase-related dioxygenase (phytanoyl-CoA dioxygenase family) [Phenylobacterium sp.]|jgi:ectoine hydroxylase-related dioxygenase (phytanoyl-CoA dioxygenase family)
MNDYQKAGFALFDQPIIAPELLANARARVDAIKRGECNTGHAHWGITNQDKPDQLQRISQVHICEQAFHDLLTQSGIGQRLAECVGAKQLKVWGSQLYIKPPAGPRGDGGDDITGHVGWHRDSQHIPFYHSGVFTLWIPLHATQSASAPITYIKGSHIDGVFDLPTGADELQLSEERARLSVGSHHEWQEVEAILPEGGMSIHHWHMIHGSAANTTADTRYGLSVGVATEKIRPGSGWDYGYHAILDDEFLCPTLF